MKLIMENWRRYITEQMAAGQEQVYPNMLKNLEELPDKIPPLTFTDIRQLISLIDPTQISAYPDIPPAIEAWKKNPSWGNSAMLVVSLTSAIPIVGKPVSIVSKFSKSLKSVKGGNKFSAKINKNITKKAPNKGYAGTKSARPASLSAAKLNTLEAHMKKVDQATDNLEQAWLRHADELQKWLSSPRSARGPRPSANKGQLKKARDEFREAVKGTSTTIVDYYRPAYKQGILKPRELELYKNATKELRRRKEHAAKMASKAKEHEEKMKRLYPSAV